LTGRLHLRLAALLAAALLSGGCGSGDGGDETPSRSAAPGCAAVEAPEPREPAAQQAPSIELNPDLTHAAVVKTNCGEFTITLAPDRSPHAVVSFATLANAGYFDDTVFHRIVPGFVIQGGDPTATGTGGPGYTTVDTPARDTTYTRGIVAMAKTGTEPRGAAGSQFFVVTGDEVALPPDYAVIGQVTSGLDVVARIGALGDPATELPTATVVIESVLIRRRG
jgi:peptidyl-prolyl cis-trans isomerase B (cyclophilin B)